MRSPLPLLLILLAAAMAAPAPAETAAGADRRRVAELIDQLGAPKYVLRQSAAQQLGGLGLAAFDQLLAAADHTDPEIAAASRRLLRTMTVRWTRPGDSPNVRRLLDSYGRLAEQQRRQSVTQLLRLPAAEATPTLCRIARFDPSERVSREAAIAAINARGFKPSEPRRAGIKSALNELDDEFGPSNRTAGVWLRLFTEQQADAPSTLRRWRRALSEERRAVDERRHYTDERILNAIEWNLLRVLLAAGEQAEAGRTVGALIDANPQNGEQTLTTALEWMLEADADEAIDAVLGSGRRQLTSKRGLYLTAMIRSRQDRADEAERLADEAFSAPPSLADEQRLNNQLVIDGRVASAGLLKRRGHTAWARREYREAAKRTPPLSINAVYARWLLADSLMDHAEYADAAAVLSEVRAAIEKDAPSRAKYDDLGDDFQKLRRYSAPLPKAGEIAGRADFCLALDARDRGDFARELRLLESALAHDPGNFDIVIAMHRAAGADDAFREATRARIRRLADEMQTRIDRNPEEPVFYNQWAWLIGNTEGDYAKAVRYSRRSLEIVRERDGYDAPGYLDTLGRCYFAAGDLDRAIETQRRAVEGEPHTMVIRRQLEFFESQRDAANQPDEQQEPATAG